MATLVIVLKLYTNILLGPFAQEGAARACWEDICSMVVDVPDSQAVWFRIVATGATGFCGLSSHPKNASYVLVIFQYYRSFLVFVREPHSLQAITTI